MAQSSGSLSIPTSVIMLNLLAQANDAAAGIIGLIAIVFYLGIIAFYIVVGWKLFTKAGQPGWASIIPIYNTIVYLQIAGRPIWWIILLFIPIVNFVVSIIVIIDFCRKFGKGTGFAVLTIFFSFITLPMLAFGSAEYDPAA